MLNLQTRTSVEKDSSSRLPAMINREDLFVRPAMGAPLKSHAHRAGEAAEVRVSVFVKLEVIRV